MDGATRHRLVEIARRHDLLLIKDSAYAFPETDPPPALVELVPARIVAVADIPRTRSGKITELAVRDVVHGREVKNREALANPEALDLYRSIPGLQN